MKLFSHVQKFNPHGDARWIFAATTPEVPDANVPDLTPEYLAQAGAEAELSQLKKSLEFVDGIEYAVVTAEKFSELTDADISQIEGLFSSEMTRGGVDAADQSKLKTAFHSTLEWAKTAGEPTQEQLIQKFSQEAVAAGVDAAVVNELSGIDDPKTAENEGADNTACERNSVHVDFKVAQIFSSMSPEERAKITELSTAQEMRTALIALFNQKFDEWMDSLSVEIGAQIQDNENAAQDFAAATTGNEGSVITAAKKGWGTVSGLMQGDKNLGNFPKNSSLSMLFAGVEIEGVPAGMYFSGEIADYVKNGGAGLDKLKEMAYPEIEKQVQSLVSDENFEDIKTKFSPMGKIEDGKRTVGDQEFLVGKLKTVSDYLIGSKFETEYKEFVEGGGNENFDRWMERRKQSMGMMEKLGLLFKQIGYWFKNLKNSFSGDAETPTSAMVTELQDQVDRAREVGSDTILKDEALDQTEWIINEESLSDFDEKDLKVRVEKKAVLPENLKTGPAADALHSLLKHDKSFFVGHRITTDDLKTFSAEFGKSFGDSKSTDVFHSNPQTKSRPGDYFVRGDEEDPGNLPKDSKYFEVEGTAGRWSRDYTFSGVAAFFTWLHRQQAVK